jgi:putative spermidine/putrescine transport system permease protein
VLGFVLAVECVVVPLIALLFHVSLVPIAGPLAAVMLLGTIGVAAIWTLLKLARPVLDGLHGAVMANKVRQSGQGASLPRTERDIPIGWVAVVTLACMAPVGLLLAHFAGSAGLQEHLALLVVGGLVYVLLMSFFVAAVCGYMAGLIGSSNSPLSGVGILVVLGVALLRLFSVVGGAGSFGWLVLAHSLVVTPYTMRLIMAALIGFDRSAEQAALSLGATRTKVFLRITLPMILPGITGGWLLAFINSFDEVTLSIFVTSPSTVTLPVRMYMYATESIDPLMAAVSALMVGLTAVAMLVLDRLYGLDKVLVGGHR